MNKTNNGMVQTILNAMQQVILKHGLELLQRYPDDLLVHDKAVLDRTVVPGAKIAWMVGHCHTHIVPLGLHPKENLNVEYLTNMASEDRFFVLNIGQGEKFSMADVDRKAFAALSNTAVPYERQGPASDFWLHRQKNKIGYVALKNVGTLNEAKVAATITPVVGISGIDRAALELWCQHAIVEMARTLFVRSEVTWAEPLLLEKAA